ncbi:uncharacterized protein LOC123398560 [Hordeum vulgare subsp. vulgare]|uniref:uncharacterized protein LOC123398560 n=1 Tax=Hordeum vulgare subsp. vulgare TaxID=112509 RepID=UPI001D1A41F3|nr:uncharacterized protein LOC123398560 [Hordeum vulgare subsp. vulgare]
MASSSLLPPSLYTIEQAMVAARSVLACQGSTLNHHSPWSSDHTRAAPRLNPRRMSAYHADTICLSLNPEATDMVEEGKVLMELWLLASYNMVNPEAADMV